MYFHRMLLYIIRSDSCWMYFSLEEFLDIDQSLSELLNDNWCILKTHSNFVLDDAFFLHIVCKREPMNSVQLPIDCERNVCLEGQDK
jgi:hypothetical protein